MFQEILAENGTKFVIAAVVVLLGLLCLALVLWIVRGRPSSPFIRGGRNRTPRLAVLDAAAIDTRRRLVLVRRDDVEHLIMIGGPTDIVIETRIATPSATEHPVEKPVQKVERAEPAPVLQETPVRAAEIAAARSTASATAGATERRPAAAPDGVSSMSKVLYAGDDEAAVRAAQVRPVTQPVTTQQQNPATAQQRTPERRAEDVLEQSRQRVLATQPAVTTTAQATVGHPVQRPVTTTAIARPVSNVADNPALVSEFERILEAEMASNAAATSAARTVAQPAAITSQATSAGAQVQPVAKSREETEAEMARLLGEIAANRKG
ncbi:flagellar biosynthetic protein FliO [Shinella sp. CPCC 101442]|uniref:flagellar biosynthetic protein FliO n=1 Tax=Shinella sp. CPCC 101442 TaxID=2932265 RepID=UPI0021526A32|nr:flagellar biosynthetic protein FliO [Shinella sp. CPCC 101442]MCR6499622.1 flagellar biosynthetic protein FliO [Shinella sp. CPCC 101442]